MDLDGFLSRAAARPWAWGEHDCTLMPADWVVERRGVDPAAAWRGTYTTALGCERRVLRAGGLLAVWTLALADAGLLAATCPWPGDVGLVVRRASDLRLRPTGAILTSECWVSLGDGDLIRADAPLIAAWSV